MSGLHRAPKQWCLSKSETITSFESWRQNLSYTLSLDPNFEQFLCEGALWKAKTKSTPLRGFSDDEGSVSADKRRTAQQKVNALELMLGQIANYCPVISRNTIVKKSTSVDHIWQTIRLHYGFQSTGAHLLDFSSIHLEPDERPEDLFQRLTAFVEDNLLRKGCGITHHGETISDDEELSPSLENYIVLTWLQLVHRDLPRLVKQRYGTELRTRTLASIKPEISQALSSLLDEIRSMEDATVMRAASSQYRDVTTRFKQKKGPIQQRPTRSCPLCKQAGRPDRHFLSQCTFLPPEDRKYMSKARQIVNILDNDTEVDDQHCVPYDTDTDVTPTDDPPTAQCNNSIRRACVLRAPAQSTTIWPGDFLEIDVNDVLQGVDDTFALEPHRNVQSRMSQDVWPSPDIYQSLSGRIRIPNLSDTPQTLKRNEHFCSIRPVFTPVTNGDYIATQTGQATSTHAAATYSAPIRLDPDKQLTQQQLANFHNIHREFDDVFNPIVRGYNGASGPFQAVVNMGPVQPPQRKGRLPQYSRDKLVELQQKFDELEEMGVFARPEDAQVNVEYINPSFLVKKPSGGSRLVTAFADVGRYSKPQPSLLPSVDSTLNQIAQWKYIITTDLTKAFYQIPLSRESLKYCGVATPFRGIRVYTRSAMGMPGSETALEELMCRVLGDLLQDGIVAKIADDLYCGACSVEELLINWKRLLQALQKNNLCLSATKTTICPATVTILGWVWHKGTIKASQHRIATLSSCSPPKTVRSLRSFIGAYKVLSRVMPHCASLLSPLEGATAGLQSSDPIVWTDDLHDALQSAQSALLSNRVITLPRPSDQLWIVTDAAVKSHGIGSTLYVTRDNKLHLAGFFSAKLRGRQSTWLPCEVEALAIAVSIKHFSPYIIQSHHKPCILTDSKPCVQAFEKLCRGEFSASPRVTTFLSAVSRYQASVRHLSGSENVPSDFASRNAQACTTPSCQICSFVERIEDSTIRSLSVHDIVSGNAKLPFTNRAAWFSLQSECPDLRRTHAHLTQGTRPSRKLTNIKDVKRYLNAVTIAKDGLLVVKRSDPLVPTRECIVIPRQVLDGFLTAIHIRLNHPSCHQMKQIIRRYFFAIELDKSIQHVCSTCHQCASLKKVPHSLIEQSTMDPPEVVGISFAADVIKRERQLVLVLRECVTSFTTACLVDDERHGTLRDALVRLCIEMRPLDGPPAVIRTDPAPGFTALANDDLLKKYKLTIEIGRVKNRNKNPVADRAIQEVEDELLRLDPLCATITPLSLAIAVAHVNCRIRSRGLSSREMWSQRDQFTSAQLPVNDQSLILNQHAERLANHSTSEKSKAPRSKAVHSPSLRVGDLVYLHADRKKSSARDRYLVVSVDSPWCNIQKFRGNQLRQTSYRVKECECYVVPSATGQSSRPNLDEAVDSALDDDFPPNPVLPPPEPPCIPPAISPERVTPDLHDTPSTYSLPTSLPSPPIHMETTSNDSDDIHHVHPPDSVPPDPVQSSPHRRQSTRKSRLPGYLRDFILDL